MKNLCLWAKKMLEEGMANKGFHVVRDDDLEYTIANQSGWHISLVAEHWTNSPCVDVDIYPPGGYPPNPKIERLSIGILQMILGEPPKKREYTTTKDDLEFIIRRGDDIFITPPPYKKEHDRIEKKIWEDAKNN